MAVVQIPPILRGVVVPEAPEVSPSFLLRWCNNAISVQDPVAAIRALRHTLLAAGVALPGPDVSD